MAKHWIQGAVKHPGALHKALHVKEGEKIPAAKLEKAAHSENPHMRHMAHFAENMKHLHGNFEPSGTEIEFYDHLGEHEKQDRNHG